MSNPTQRTKSIEVAVYWPGEGYGMPEEVPDMKAAQRAAEQLASLRYEGENAEIHIIKTVREVTVYEQI